MKGTAIFAPSEQKLGQERKKRTFTLRIKWVTLSGVLDDVVLPGAREEGEKDVEGARVSCLNVKVITVP